MDAKKILIVDDKADNLYLLNTLLTGHGYNVVGAGHGVEALAKARQNPPDIIISDILMPVMDGFTLCREWKKDINLKYIPFIFYTATYTDERDEDFALGLGADKFVVMPQEPDAFIKIVEDTLRAIADAASATVRLTEEKTEKEENVFLKEYNEVLIRKLEAKTEQLEIANRKLHEDIDAQKQEEEKIILSNEELERQIAERTAKLEETVANLEKLNRVFVGREIKMAELKARIAELEKKVRNDS